MTDHDELRRLAEAATPTYRLVQGECANPALAIDGDGEKVDVFWPGSFEDYPDDDTLAWRSNAEFIVAADPQTVLGLLDESKRRANQRDELAETLIDAQREKLAIIKHHDELLAERDELRAKVERVHEALDRIVLPHQETGEPTSPSHRPVADYVRAHMDGGSDE